METDPGPRKSSRLELAVVIGIVSILLILFIPGIINLFSKSEEETTLANLGTLRSALAAYYTDNQQYPVDDLKSLFSSSKYISTVPIVLSNPAHPPSHVVMAENSPTDTGKWSYVNDPKDPAFGSIHVGCTHPDAKGVIWSTY